MIPPFPTAPPRPIVFADLDDTLFQTAAKMAEPAAEARRAATATNDRHSYMSAVQAATIAWLLITTRLIPVTARSSEALSRVHLPFNDWRICANGGAILDWKGVPDPAWRDHVAGISAQHREGFAALVAAAATMPEGAGLRSWVVTETDLPIYFVAKTGRAVGAGVLSELEARCRVAVGDSFLFHRNGRNMSFTPRGLAKRDAVAALLSRLPEAGDVPIWGMGDSVSDLGFMRLCQMMVVPVPSQIATAMEGF